MATTPIFSSLSAVTELGVTAAVYLFLYSAYYKDVFRTGLITFALTYEVLINIAYMTFRLVNPPPDVEYSDAMTSFLAFHGVLSLVMFIGLVVLVAAAIRWHRRGDNLLRANPQMTVAFVVAWAVSVLSGELIYILTYLT